MLQYMGLQIVTHDLATEQQNLNNHINVQVEQLGASATGLEDFRRGRVVQGILNSAHREFRDHTESLQHRQFPLASSPGLFQASIFWNPKGHFK